MKALLPLGVRGTEQERENGSQRSKFLMLLEMVFSLRTDNSSGKQTFGMGGNNKERGALSSET